MFLSAGPSNTVTNNGQHKRCNKRAKPVQTQTKRKFFLVPCGQKLFYTLMNKTSFPILSQITSDLIIILFFLCRTMPNPLRPMSNLPKSLWFQSDTICSSSLGPKKHPSSGNKSRQGSHRSSVVLNWHELGLPRCVAASGSDPARPAVSSPRFLPPHSALPSQTGSQGLSKSYLKSSLTELSSGILAERTELLTWDVQKHSVGLRAQSLLLLHRIAFLPAAFSCLVLQQLPSFYVLPLTSLTTYHVKPIISDF